MVAHRESIFLRIPKNATTSIEGAIADYPWILLNSQLEVLSRSGYPNEWLERGLPAMWMEALGRDRWEAAHVFTFVRNPYDRAVSSYKHTCKLLRQRSTASKLLSAGARAGRGKGTATAGALRKSLKGELSFDDFLRLVEEDALPSAGARWHSTLQSRHVTDEAGDVVVDFVGKFESLQEDFERLCKEIGIEGIALPTLNTSKMAGAYEDFYDEGRMRAVSRIYEADFETFGYEIGSLGPSPTRHP